MPIPVAVNNVMNNHITKQNVKKGFTLIEIIIYISLVSMLLTGLVTFMLDSLTIREKATEQNNISANARRVLERVAYEVRNAESINTLNSSSLQLTSSDRGTTTLDLQSGAVQISQDGVNAELTDNTVTVTDLTFENLSFGISENIKVSITLTDESTTDTFTTSIEKRNQ